LKSMQMPSGIANLPFFCPLIHQLDNFSDIETIIKKCCNQDPFISSLFLEELSYYANR
jgi:hypothetical protein